jgi:predicted GIY-YIG superfamily endonuclease
MMAEKRKTVKWHLYVLRCRDGTFYTGITNDLERRLEQHNNGKASRYTRARVPVTLIYREGCRNKSSALKKEFRIKSLSRKEKDGYIARKTRRLKTTARRRT